MEFPKQGPQTDSERIKQRIGYTEADRTIDSSIFPKGMPDEDTVAFTIGADCPSLSYGLMKELFGKKSWKQLDKKQQRFINQIVLMVDKTFAGKRDVDNANQGDDWTFNLPKNGEQATFSFYPRKGKGISITAEPLEYFDDADEEKQFQQASRELLIINRMGNNMSLTDSLKQLRQKVSYKDRVRLLRDEGKVWSAERIETVGGFTEVIDAVNEEMKEMMRLPGISDDHRQEIFNAWFDQKLDRKGGPNSNLNYTGTGFQNLAWLITIRHLMKNPASDAEKIAALKGIGFLGGHEIIDNADEIVFKPTKVQKTEFDPSKVEGFDDEEDTGSTEAWDELFQGKPSLKKDSGRTDDWDALFSDD